jgi:hypothetical protein
LIFPLNFSRFGHSSRWLASGYFNALQDRLDVARTNLLFRPTGDEGIDPN